MNRTRLFLALALWATLATACLAGKVKTWHQQRPADHDKSSLKKVVLSSTGSVSLGRQMKSLAALDATHVWAVAEDRAGALYAATGDEGRLYRVSPGGKVSVAWSSEHSQVLSLCVGPDGSVYAGTGPSAVVVQVDPKGSAKVLCELPESYVWSLVVGPKDGALYAGTGPHGKVYKIGADGKAAVFHDTKQEHVLCLAAAEDGTLYAGTDRTGRVLKIDAKGKGFVLHQAHQSEVRTLLWTAEGLYFGTASTKKRGSSTASGGSSSSVAALGAGGAEAVAVKLRAEKEGASAKSEAPAKSKEPSKATSAPAPTLPGSGENSVYKVTADGAVRELFRGKLLVLSLLRWGKGLLVGTGLEGQLFEIDEATREKTEIARLDHGQVLTLLRRRDGSVVLGAGDPGKLYVLEERYVKEGTLTSEVLDAKLISKWGALRWQAEVPAKTGVSVAVRSGNVAEPDETWSDWSEEQSDGDSASVPAPAARFLQYRLTLSTEDQKVSPAVHSVTVRYATTNQAPEVTKVEVPDLASTNLESPKKLKLKWTAQDPNEDELTYRVYIRKEGWASWVLLEEKLEKAELEWDTTTTPSGTYRVKVVASDAHDNPPAEALKGERVSDPVVVCHEAPKVAVKVAKVEDGKAVVEATASSPLVRLTAGSYALDGKKWAQVFPADGLYDSRSESFRFRTAALKPGTHVLVLKVQDAAGNTGTADVVFVVK